MSHTTRTVRFFVSFMLAAVAVVGLSLTTAAAASPKFGPMPRLANAKKSNLEVRIVKYDGSTNGQMVVDVRNTGSKSETFDAKGLFFVPDGDPERAPQRLGAAGPFVTQVGKDWKAMEQMAIGPNETRRMKLSVFCIDSHRSSPSSQTKFSLAKQRLPKELRQEITAGTQKIMKASKAKSAFEAASDVQGHVWKTRDKKWIKLEGERKQEKASQKQQLQRRDEAPRQQQMKRYSPLEQPQQSK